MKKEILFDYISKGFGELGFLRESYLEDLEILDKTNIIKVITGMRRVGKSFILKQFINKKIYNGIKKENIFYLHFEDYRLGDNPDLKLLGDLFEYFLENIYIGGDFYIFLDEIQNVNSWEKFVRTINEKYQNKAHIFITGSNSNLLSSELSTLLTGRFFSLQVYPLNFRDYLKFNNLSLKSELDTKKIDYFKEYIKYGSLPEILKIEDTNTKENYIKGLIDSILFKDIITRYKLRKTAFISSLLKFIYINTCSLLSINSILKFLKQDIKSLDYETVDNYINYLENSFLINKLDGKNIKTKEILKSNKKYYSYDLGIRNVFSNNNDIEKIIENFVYLELKRRGYNIWVVNNSIYEIDFLAEKNNKKIYFQVSYTIKNEDTYKREIKPLLIQKDNYKKIILTLDEGEEEDRGIIIKNIIDWSLEEEKNMI